MSDSSVDYGMAADTANTMADNVYEMQTNIISAYDEMKAMAEHWEGNSYNSFASIANSSITNLNNIFLQAKSCSEELYAKIYALADADIDENGTPASTSLSSYKEHDVENITEISDSGDGAFGLFEGDSITACQSKIEDYLNDAYDSAENARNEVIALKDYWKDSTGTMNADETKASLNVVKTIINSLKENLSLIISQRAALIDTLNAAADTIEAATDLAGNTIDNTVEAAQNAVSTLKQKASDTWKSMLGQQ